MEYVAQPPKVIPFQAVLFARRNRPDIWPELQKALAAGTIVLGPPTAVEEFYKAAPPGSGTERAGHKYIRRVYTGDPRHPWAYQYAQQLSLPLGDRELEHHDDDADRPAPQEQPQQLALFTIPQPRTAPERRERPAAPARPLQLVAQPHQGALDFLRPTETPAAPAPAPAPPPPAELPAPPPPPADDRFVLGSYVSKRGNLKRVAKFTRRVERDEWGVLASLAREHGGSYVREAGGFVFRDDAGYDTFMAALASHGGAAPAPPEHVVEVAPEAPAAPESAPVVPPSETSAEVAPAPPVAAEKRESEPGWERMPEAERGQRRSGPTSMRSPTVGEIATARSALREIGDGISLKLNGGSALLQSLLGHPLKGDTATRVMDYMTGHGWVSEGDPGVARDAAWQESIDRGLSVTGLRFKRLVDSAAPRQSEPGWDRMPEKDRLDRQARARGWTGEITASGGVLSSPDGKTTVSVTRLDNGKWAVQKDAPNFHRRLSGETGDQHEILDDTGALYAVVPGHGDEFETLAAASAVASEGMRIETTHPAASKIIDTFRAADKSWHAGLEAGHALLALKHGGEYTYSNGRMVKVDAAVDPEEVKTRPLGLHVKKRLKEHFVDSYGETSYYGAEAPQDALTMWQQKVDGLKLVRDETMEQRAASPAWAAAGAKLDKAIADIEAQRPLFATIQTVTEGKRFAASSTHSAANEIEHALRLVDDDKAERAVSEPGWDRMPDKEQEPAAPPPPPEPAPPPAPSVTRETLIADVRRAILDDPFMRQVAENNGQGNFTLEASRRIQAALVDRIEDAIAGGAAKEIDALLGDKEGTKRLAAELYRDLRPAPVVTPPSASVEVRRMSGAVGLTAGERKKANARALDLVAAAATRKLTDAELDDVARYSGKGGIGSSLNQYFTRPDVAAAIWARAAALSGGEVKTALEPACGSGVFLATAPEGVKVTGVELDPEVAGVAAVLHGDRHTVLSSSFEDYAVRNEGVNPVDVVITNAPFVTRTGGGAKLHKPELANADQYFLDTAIDQARDGGVVAMIVHHSVMTGNGAAEFRARLAARAELVDAYRLPGEAFKHAGTEVTTDVLFLRKRPAVVGAALLAGGEDLARKVGAYDEAFVAGDWYASRPDRVLGQTVKDWRGNDAVTGTADTVAGTIAAGTAAPPKAVTLDDIRAATGQDEGAAKAVERAVSAASATPAAGASKVINGVTYVLTGDPPRWKRVDEIDDVAAILGHTPSEALVEAKKLTESLDDLRKALDSGDYYRARHLRRSTADRVRAWVEAYGLPAEHEQLNRLAKTDKSAMLLVGAVHADGTLSDMLLRDPPSSGTVRKDVDRSDLRDVAEAVAATSDGVVNVGDVARLWSGAEGQTEAELRAKVLALDTFAVETSGEIRHLEDYLTGDVFGKRDALDDATDPKLVWQREQLDGLIRSRWRPLDDVEIQLRSGWVPPAVLGAFLSSEAGQKLTSWNYDPDRRVTVQYKDSWYTVTTTTTDVKGVTTTKTDKGDDGEIARYLNRSRLSQREREKIEEVDAAFGEWVKGSQWREEVEENYNRAFFGDVRKAFSGSALHLPGLNPEITPHDYQNAAVRWADDAGTGIIALDVGLGKTLTGILLARQAKAQGKAKRPVIVVPKSVATNWQREIERVTPGARVLVIGETSVEVASGKNKGKRVAKADDADERNRKLALAQQNDYDAIIITRPAFERIPLRPETIDRFEDDDFWTERATALEKAGGKTLAVVEKKREKVKAAFDAATAARKFEHEKALVYWEDLGADFLMADEAHSYKNLYEAKQRFGQSPKFLGGSGTSKQSKDMQHKARVVRERTKAGGVYFLTATPTKNSPLEIYSMTAHLVPEEWESRGIRNSEEFIDRYCTLENRMVLNSDGEMEESLAVTGFRNLTEIQDLMDRYVLQRGATDVGLKIPEAQQVTEFVDMHPAQRAAYDQIREEAKKAKDDKDPNKAKGSMFRSLDQMRKAATDLELLDPDRYAGWHTKSPKYKRAVEKITEGAKRGGQVVFVDSVASHERLKGMLVAGGMKPEEIAIINAQVAPDSEQRYEIGEAFNRGDVKVVIGNTATMGEGVNLQRRTTDIHHLDQPWDPGSMQQRNGRGVRQGNAAASVTVHTYLCKRSFDGFRHGTLQGKRGWLEKLRSGADTIGNDAADAELSHEDVLVMLADDPDAARAELDKRKAEKLDEWKAAKRAEAMRRVGQILAMRERLRGLVADSPPAEILRNKITVALKRVKGDENLPASAHALLDNERVRAVIDPATGKAFVAGAIVERDSYRYVVQNVDPARSKVQLRYLNAGYGSEHWSDVSAAGASYTPTDMTDREAFDEALDNIAKSNKTFRAFENLSTFRPELIAENAETVSAALTRAFRASEDKTDKAPMVTPSGEIVVMTSTQARERPDLRMVVPVGADWTRLVDAATEASRPEKARNLKWAESAVYMNPIIGSLGWVYGDKLRSDLLAAVRRRLA